MTASTLIPTVRTRRELRNIIGGWRKDGASIGVVPTMGALHIGHLKLVHTALEQTDKVIVTLFVNPRQFNNAEDLANYPRTELEDAAKLSPLGAHVLYAPRPEEIYPEGFSTNISVGRVSEGLCGAHRSGHFDGVATVVTKLLLQTQADKAFFGEKDYQQLHVIKRLVNDLDIPVGIVPVPTVREADGLAYSSRNQRLTAAERAIAPALASALFTASRMLAAGGNPDLALQEARQTILNAGFTMIEYLELRAEDNLAPLQIPDRPARLLVAAWLGDVRLIDNVPVTISGS